jgi:CheY-like chemotaxis protein/anti-sigma regulatory factor (Ser/Thr protein kinase)
MAQPKYRICVVDDEERIGWLLRDLFTQRGHSVLCATSGQQALDAIRRHPVDMVIADIKMPGMDGFELLAILERSFPEVKRVLMTGCDIDEYLALIRRQQIGNILSKGSDFQFEEVVRYIEMLLSGNVFGLDKVFEERSIRRATVASGQQAHQVCHQIVGEYDGSDRVFVEMAVNELVTNAVFHAVLQLTGIPRDLWDDEYVLDGGKSVTVSWAKDEEKTGISIEDPMGRLRKNDVLRWLDQGIGGDGGGEEHGRGLQLVRHLIDRLIINIDPGKRTECILLQYRDRARPLPSKPILIREL